MQETNQALQTQRQNSSLELAEVRRVTENGLIPVERRTMVAHSCPKISDDTSETEIKQFIVYAMALIGFPPERYPDDMEKILLVNSIRAEMRHYSLEELRLAFSFAVSRKFTVDLRFYQDSRFSFEYISRVIAAYDKFTAEMISAELRRQKSEQVLRDTEFKQLTPDEALKQGKSQYEFVVKIFREENRPPIFADWTLIFRYLEHNEQIKDSREEKKIFFEKVKSMLAEETAQKIKNGKRGDVHLYDELKRIQKGDIVVQCRKLRVLEYIKELIAKENEQSELS